MRIITEFTDNPKQTCTLVLENQETVAFNLYFYETQLSWYFDFTYNELVTYNNSQFTGDSIHALELYLSYGLEFKLSKNTSINLSCIPQLFLFKDNTERGIENNLMENSLAIGYNFGLTHTF